MFLYNDTGTFDTAYFITPCEAGTEVRHQYGCASCLQFREKGHVATVSPRALAEQFSEFLGCNPAPVDVISMKTGITCEEVLGEGLCRLADGRYVATENCD